MSATLLSEAGYEAIKGSLRFPKWENENPEFPLGYWIPTSIVKIIRHLLDETYILKEIRDLPIFFGDNAIEKMVYGEALTCLCLSKQEGSYIRGISILMPYWFDDFYFGTRKCFRYHAPEDKEYYWRYILDWSDIECLSGYWDEHSSFGEWSMLL
jgi:hypothetical protein